jgi:hypothetical protein
MTKKSIYTSNELPDSALEEFEYIRDVFRSLIETLSEKYSIVSINAGMAKAQLDLLLTAYPQNLKQVLLNNAEYYRQAAEKVEKK